MLARSRTLVILLTSLSFVVWHGAFAQESKSGSNGAAKDSHIVTENKTITSGSGKSVGPRKDARTFEDLRYDLAGPNPAHSLHELNETIRLHPRSPEAFLHRGQAYLADGDSENALKDFRKALIIDPKFAPSYIGIARVMRGSLKYDAAFSALHKAEELGDKDVAISALWESAFLHRELKQMDIALQQFNAVLKNPFVDNSRQALALFQRGELYVRTNQNEKALVDLDRAVKLDPKVYDFHLVRAHVYAAMNKPNQALSDLNIAIESQKQTNSPEMFSGSSQNLVRLYKCRAALYQQLGKMVLAQRDLKAAKDYEMATLKAVPFRSLEPAF